MADVLNKWFDSRRGVLLCAALLLAVALLPAALTAQDEPPADPPAGEEEEAQPASPAETTEGEPSGDEATTPSAEEPAEELPEIRRLPPRTDDEERRYKLAKAQNDPFLLDQLNGELREGPGEFYDPLDSVRPVTHSDLSRYLVQNKDGLVLGHVEIGVELDPGTDLLQLEIRNEIEPPTSIIVVATADTLDALSSERSLLRFSRPGIVAPAGAADPASPAITPLQDTPHTSVTYEFDRISVRQGQGGVESHVRLRELPFSFDRDLLPLLLRQVDYQQIAWPFEAVATDTAQLRNLPLALDKPRRVTVLSAEPASYYCFESELRLGAEVTTWWVEQVPPCRLVKFRMEGLTYTLERYVQQ